MSPASEELRQLAAEAREDVNRRLREEIERENAERRAERLAAGSSLLDSRGLML
jgi:hypothetical protein